MHNGKFMKRKSNNKGFSLVELIVVIAIMAVLVGVVTPLYLRYLESSRRSEDIRTALQLRKAILADIADEKITEYANKVAFLGGAADEETVKNNPCQYSTTVYSSPRLQGSTVERGGNFYVIYDEEDESVMIYADPECTEYCLTEDDGAEKYKRD